MKYSDLEKAVGVLDQGKVHGLLKRYNQLVDVKQVCVDAGIKTGVSYAAFVECLVNDSKELERIKCLCNNNGAKPSETPYDYISKVFTVNESYAKSIALLDDKLKVLQSKYNAQNAAVSVWKGYEKRIEAAIGEDHQNGAIGHAADLVEQISDLAQALDTIGFKYTCPVQAATELTTTLLNHYISVNGITDPNSLVDLLAQPSAQAIFTKQQYLDSGWTEQQIIDQGIQVKPTPNTIVCTEIMSILAKHLNKPIGVYDIEPAIKELISTKPTSALINGKPITIITNKPDKDNYLVVEINDVYHVVPNEDVKFLQPLTLALMEQLDLPLETVQKLQLNFKVEAL